MSGWRAASAVIALGAYAVVAYLLMTHWPDSPAAIVLLLGPVVGAVGIAAVRNRHLPTALLALGLAALLIVLCAVGSRVGVERLYVLQHAVVHGVLAATFGWTLRPGSVPLITRLGARIHTVFTPAMRAYTRRLTAVWTLYFVAMIVVSLAIYTLRPWSEWALFGNVLTPLSALALFVIEHLLRYLRHPEFERVSLAAVVRAYRADAGAQRAAR